MHTVCALTDTSWRRRSYLPETTRNSRAMASGFRPLDFAFNRGGPHRPFRLKKNQKNYEWLTKLGMSCSNIPPAY